MLILSGAKLNKFFIFNPSRGTREGSEHEKIIYHWSSDDLACTLNDKIQDVCLCEASITLAKQFDQIKRHSLALAFSHSKLVVSEVEPDFWIGASVSKANGANTNETSANLHPSTSTSTMTSHQSTDSTTDNSTPTSASPSQPMNLPDDTIVGDGMLESVIANQYRLFCLLRGPISYHVSMTDSNTGEQETSDGPSNTNEADIKRLREMCTDHFDATLPSIKLSSCITNLVELFGQIQYLNLDSLSLMKVNSFTNHLCCLDVNNITHTVVIFNDQLIWSSLTLEDTRVLYHYMISVVIREALDAELSGEVEKVRKLAQDIEIYLNDVSPNSKPRPYYMTVFRSSNDLTMCIILRQSNLGQLLAKCERYLLGSPSLGLIPMVSLGQIVGQNFLKLNGRIVPSSPLATTGNTNSNPANSIMSTNASIKFAYSDRTLASHRSPLMMRTVDNDLFAKNMRFSKYIMDLEWDLELIESSEASKDIQEIVSRTVSDTWLSAYKSCSRVVYSLHGNRNASLAEAASSNSQLVKQLQDMMI